MATLKFLNPETKKWEELSVCQDGVTFIPTIDANGNLSWDNNGYLPNPDPINIYGKSFVNYDKIEDFPLVGNDNLLYIDLSSNRIYRWDKENNTYVGLSGQGGGTGDFEIKVVDVLPAHGLSNAIYCVPNNINGAINNYDEYIWLNDNWEKLGSLMLDHSITIGPEKFDGTKDITIPIYNGE